MIKNIVFDIGMVLIDFHWQKTMQELGFSKETIECLGENMVCNKMWSHMDLNDIPEDELVKKFKEMSPDYTNEIDLFFENIEDVITMYEGADIWLKMLRDKGYNIYLLSNYPKRMFEMHKKRFKFLPYTKGRIVSYECNLIKPDIRIYQLLCERYKLVPEECIFLDDRDENIEVAKQLGFKGVVVKNPFEIREELEQYLNKEMLDYVDDYLKKNAVNDYKDFSGSLIPGCDNILGVKIPKLRELAKEISQCDWRYFLENASCDSFEKVMLQGMVIGYAKTDIEETLYYFEKFIPKINNWSVNDCVCATLKCVNKNRDRVWSFLGKYKDVDDEFAQRVVAVMLMDYYLVDEYIDRVFEMWQELKHPGYYRMMGVAWGVATAYAKFPEKTYSFLQDNKLDDVTYNKAIQKMLESNRISSEEKARLRLMKR